MTPLFYTISVYTRSKSFDVCTRTSEKTEGREKRKWSTLKGIFFATLSAIAGVFLAVIVKKISLHPAQCAFYRFTGSIAFTFPGIVKCRENPFGSKGFKLTLMLAGIFGSSCMFLAFIAYIYLPLSEVFVIYASTPIFVAVAAHIFLNELCNMFQSVLLVFAVIGIVLTTKLPSQIMAGDISYNLDNMYGFVAAMSAVLCKSGQMIIIRKAKHVPHVLETFACSWTGLLESALLMPVFTEVKLHKCGIQWVGIVLLAFLSFLDQEFMSIALHSETAGIVAIVKCTVNIILGFLAQIFLFHDKIEYFSIVGAILVSLSVASLSLRKLMTHG